MKQTAIEWFAEQLFKTNNNTTDSKKIDVKSIIEQAKEMEIEKLKNAWESSDTNMRNQFSSSAYKAITFNQWFETFKTK